MRKTIIAAACAALISSTAFAQTSQPQAGTSGSTSEMSKDHMKKSTTGMSHESKGKSAMKKDSMKKNMEPNEGTDSSGGMSK